MWYFLWQTLLLLLLLDESEGAFHRADVCSKYNVTLCRTCCGGMGVGGAVVERVENIYVYMLDVRTKRGAI